MAVPYPGANPPQSWANSLVDAVNALGLGYVMWSGTIASPISLTAGNFRSLPMTSAADFTGDPTPDLALNWNSHCWSPPQDGHYAVTLQIGYSANSSGNRLAGLLKNPTGNTLNAGSVTGTWLRRSKFAPSNDTAAGVIVWQGWLLATDRIMCVARSTEALPVIDDPAETIVIVEFKRSAR